MSILLSNLGSPFFKMLAFTNFFNKRVVQSLRTLDKQQRQELIETIWPPVDVGHSAFDDVSSNAFVSHIANELDQLGRHGRLFAAPDFDATLKIIKVIRNNALKPYDEIVRGLHVQFPDAAPDAIRRSVELSVRIWLTINTHSSDIFVGPMSARDILIEWPGDTSLDQLFRNHFGRRVQVDDRTKTAKFDPAFTAAYLVNTCGMKLRWTDDIASHLTFDLENRLLTVYPHKACLVSHLNDRRGCPMPREILEETLDTMNLLFPFGCLATKDLLLEKDQKPMYSLGSCGRGRKLDLAHFRYFGGAMQQLSEAFNNAPLTWRQLAFDRRNKLEWSAFWITVMVAVLTVVSIPCNIIQATYSVKAYRVALAQENDASRR
jgi:hypothetical protein